MKRNYFCFVLDHNRLKKFYSITLYKKNENISLSSDNWCLCVIIHHIFKNDELKRVALYSKYWFF